MKKRTSSKTSPDIKKIKTDMVKIKKSLAKSMSETLMLKSRATKAEKAVSTVDKKLEKLSAAILDLESHGALALMLETAEITDSHVYYDRETDTYSFVTDVEFNLRSKLSDISVGSDGIGGFVCKCRRNDGTRLVLNNEIVFNNETFPSYGGLLRFEIWHSSWLFKIAYTEIKGVEDEPPGM